jgi:hypothetical protein
MRKQQFQQFPVIFRKWGRALTTMDADKTNLVFPNRDGCARNV